VNASSSHAKRTICVLEFIPHTFTAMAHGEELGEITGVQENFYEEKSRLITSGRLGTFLVICITIMVFCRHIPSEPLLLAKKF
jgi:hypothetical protein